MTKKYIINGVEIEEFKIDPNMDTYLQGLPSKFNQLLDALDEKKEEPKPEYYDHSKTKMYLVRENGTVDKFTEPKSTLREDIKEILCEAMYLKPEYLDPTGNKDTDKIISLFKDILLKEINKLNPVYATRDTNLGYSDAKLDITNKIKNL